MKKRLIAIMLVLAMTFSTNISRISDAFAATVLTEDNMAEMVLFVKNRLEIGEEYTVFNYDFNESSDGANWYFYWNTEDDTRAVSVQCDGNKHIEYYGVMDYSDAPGAPLYTSDELLKNAEEGIAKIAPEVADSVVFKSSSAYIGIKSYIYKFNRIENGIEMPDNQVCVYVNYITGEVIRFSANWLYDISVPSAKGIMTADEAAKIIGKKVEMKLSYYIASDEAGNEKAFLAYVPDTSYIAVDAKSGKVYTEKTYWGGNFDDATNSTEEAAVADSVDKGGAYLTEAELAKIAGLKNIITSDEAVEIIRSNKYLFVDENINYTSARLQGADETGYCWNISMSDNRPYDWNSNDYYRAYAYASIDAATGEILSYYSSLKSYYDFSDEEVKTVKAKYTKTQCRNAFEAFVKAENGARFEKTALGNVSTNHPIAYNDITGNYTYAGFTFMYDRYNESIPVNGNYIYGSVDAVTGKINSYNYNWNDVELPSSTGVIGSDKAFDAYIAYEGYDLVYEVVTNYKSDDEYGSKAQNSVRLVYRTAISSAYVDAFTGKHLNYNGDEYIDETAAYDYSDIKGTKYERAIEILASLGIGFESDKYEPSKNITEKEFVELMNQLYYFFGYTNADSAKPKKLTRQNAAKILVSGLGYDEIAGLNIFATGYSDEAKISKGYKGYVAIAKGLGLMKAASGKKFKPKTSVTRGEAAQILVNAISLK